MKKVTVIGAGNGGLCAAYRLSQQGFYVCIYDSPNFKAQIDAINKTGHIVALDGKDGDNYQNAGKEEITVATTDIKEAMAFSDIFVMICPSFAQELLYAQMLPHLKKNDTVIVMPGNFASLVFSAKTDSTLNITFVDAISIPWATRIMGDATIAIMGTKEFLPLSVYPKKNDTTAMREKIDAVIPIATEYLTDPMHAGIENINFGGHPLMTMLNIGLLENFNGEFNYYYDCCSVSTARVADSLDKERVKIANSLGYDVRTELEAMNALYASDFETIYDFNRASKTHAKIKDAPNSSNSRYITEDVPYLMVPIYEMSKLGGVECNLLKSVITLAGALCGRDFFTEGRTLEKMGFTNMSADEIKKILRGMN